MLLSVNLKMTGELWMGGMCGRYVLLASEIVLAVGFVIEIASVLDCDGIPLLGPIGAVALGDDLPSDTHCASEAG